MLHCQMCGRIFQIWAQWIDSKTIVAFISYIFTVISLEITIWLSYKF